jgi:hypothetical protein
MKLVEDLEIIGVARDQCRNPMIKQRGGEMRIQKTFPA